MVQLNLDFWSFVHNRIQGLKTSYRFMLEAGYDKEKSGIGHSEKVITVNCRHICMCRRTRVVIELRSSVIFYYRFPKIRDQSYDYANLMTYKLQPCYVLPVRSTRSHVLATVPFGRTYRQ